MSFLQLDGESYTRVLYAWGALGLLSALAIHFTRMLPISSKTDSGALSVLGMVDKRAGWIIMETPVLLAILYCFLQGAQPLNVSVVFVAAFVVHYANRALIYPFRIKVAGKKMPVSMVLSSMAFYIINGYLLGYYFGSLREYPLQWLYDPRFVVGMALFIVGFAINIQSDNILINLRTPGETAYKIPRGGFFRFVSCPHYFGEMLEWAGFAIMSWSLPGVVYAVWVALPLLAQALSAHRWYLDEFGSEYPPDRRAVIPGII